ncbi:MAG: PleD family two-component system response regulator [Proteobacteria bacterium]|nr:PleD family two-component system response regulator [Pseudomonadota bacterium]
MDKESSILIVDDNPENLKVIGNIVKAIVPRIVFANSGEQAFDFLEKAQPDLILLDIMMPVMDGYEVCRRLKTDIRTSNIPVIFLTALDADTDETTGLELGAVDYITKPIKADILKARLKTHLRLKHKTDLLESLALIDGLTDIPNRRRFDELLQTEWQRAIRESTGLSLILIDIDFFKKYNDLYGHAGGDECLRSVAQALKRTTKRPADCVARYGGEEFAGILPATENREAAAIAEKMRDNVAALNIIHEQNDGNGRVTISLGVATIRPQRNSDPLTLIELADGFLYRAKEQGRNRVFAG